MDVISRQAAIDACIRVREYRAYDEIEEIKALPSAELATNLQPTCNLASDCISRQAVYNVLDKMPVRGFKKDGETIHGLISLSQVNSAIINLPSAQSEPKWIPVSERLPEKGGDYLTTLTDKDGTYVDVTEWQTIIGGRWVAPIDECDYCEIGNVTAWMPLPEPYREGET